MAYQVGPFCYGSAAAANTAAASSMVGSIVHQGGSAFVVAVDSVTDSTVTYRFDPVAGGSSFTLAAPASPLACGLLDWQDGLTLGWSIAAVWIATAAVMFLRKGVHT